MNMFTGKGKELIDVLYVHFRTIFVRICTWIDNCSFW